MAKYGIVEITGMTIDGVFHKFSPPITMDDDENNAESKEVINGMGGKWKDYCIKKYPRLTVDANSGIIQI